MEASGLLGKPGRALSLESRRPARKAAFVFQREESVEEEGSEKIYQTSFCVAGHFLLRVGALSSHPPMTLTAGAQIVLRTGAASQ